ncbi:hypothetical protein ACIA5G_25695 [Amycolatopsis sp. NPDC051758]|uniref:hypothetical protein n=1 Tax=Amycolatopsis sp. NPDC051758 TaxID=3363935 RepID=UPI0037885E6C
MLDVLIDGLLGGLVDGATTRRRARKKAERRQRDFAAGADVKLPCSLRRPPGSGSWAHGTLRLAPDGAIWRPRLNRGDPVTLSPRSVSWLGTHSAEPGHGLFLATAMTVAVLDAGGHRLELAVLSKDVTLLRKTFP